MSIEKSFDELEKLFIANEETLAQLGKGFASCKTEIQVSESLSEGFLTLQMKGFATLQAQVFVCEALSELDPSGPATFFERANMYRECATISLEKLKSVIHKL